MRKKCADYNARYELAYFVQTTFKTVNGGLRRIASAFLPQLSGHLTLNRRITALSYDSKKKTVKLTSRPSGPLSTETQTTEHDYTILALPFPELRKFRLPTLTPLHHRAINNLNYQQACKVALQFKRRWWERDIAKPIYGGCGATDIRGIGNFCYPSFDVNGTGPGVLLASYVIGENALRYVSLTDDEHIGLVLDAVEEIHGHEVDVRKLWTGEAKRTCWVAEEGASAGWAEPFAGQHELYIPAYFETVQNTILVGEHTSFTHAWIAAALESSIRGAVQLCLELGLVEEAKEIVAEWLGRW
jgi:monoamine oxidase